MRVDDLLGRPSRFTCPECHGALREIEDGSLLRFRCHVGHSFGTDAVLASQAEEIGPAVGHTGRPAEGRASACDDDVRIVQDLMRGGEAGSGVTRSRGQWNITAHGDAKDD